MVAKAYKSKKAKGTRLENKIASKLRFALGIHAVRMPLSGAMAHFKGDVYAPAFPFTIEAKNQEKVQIWKFWKQAEEQATVVKPPLLVFSGNHRPVLACLELDELISMQLEIKELHAEIKELKEKDE